MRKHEDVSDAVNDSRERQAEKRAGNPTRQICYGKRCAFHHPVRVGVWSTHQLLLELREVQRVMFGKVTV